MEYLFSEEGLRLLSGFVARDTFLAFDFDGTLAPIVDVPGSASLDGATRGLLERLAARASVGVISGRSVADLESRLGRTACALVGNHGLEHPGVASESRSALSGICASWRSQLEGGLAWDPGIRLEDKECTLSLHYRAALDRGSAEAVLRERAGRLVPAPRVVGGHCVLNLLPSAATHKGTALLALMRQAGAPSALYVGDDDTDEDVFALGRADILSVRVGAKAGSAARFYVREQGEVGTLLRCLTAFHAVMG